MDYRAGINYLGKWKTFAPKTKSDHIFLVVQLLGCHYTNRGIQCPVLLSSFLPRTVSLLSSYFHHFISYLKMKTDESMKISDCIYLLTYLLTHLLTYLLIYLLTYLTFRRRNFLLNFSTPVFKMRIIQEPKKVPLWNKRHFEEEKTESM